MNDEQEQPRWPQGPSPRPLRYGWAVVVSLLLGLSLLLDRNSAWLPLINRAIDLIQLQIAPQGAGGQAAEQH